MTGGQSNTHNWEEMRRAQCLQRRPTARLSQLFRHFSQADAVCVDQTGSAASCCHSCNAIATTGAAAAADNAVAAFHRMPLFHPSWQFTPAMKDQMDKDGHVIFPGLMTAEAVRTATDACVRVQAMHEEFTDRIAPLREAHAARVELARSDAEREKLEEERWKPGADGDFNLVLNPGSNCAEMDPFFEAAIGHPDMRKIVEGVFDKDWRFDHCTMANRKGGNGGIGWHSHGGSDTDSWYDQPRGFIRVFWYINGFAAGDGNLKVVPGSHLHRRDPMRGFSSDEAAQAGWIDGRLHPITKRSLKIEHLACPRGTVIAMWTHAAHAVEPKASGTDTRYTLITGYRQPQCHEVSKWITPAFYRRNTMGLPPLAKDFSVLDEFGRPLSTLPGRSEFRPS